MQDKENSFVLPYTFDVKILTTLFERLLACEHYLVVSTALHWVYEHIDYFCPLHRTSLLNVLISPAILPRLFLHWEKTVRSLFFTVIVYKLIPASLPSVCIQLLDNLTVKLKCPGHVNILPVAMVTMETHGLPRDSSLASVTSTLANLSGFLDVLCHTPGVWLEPSKPLLAPSTTLLELSKFSLEPSIWTVALGEYRRQSGIYGSSALAQLTSTAEMGMKWFKVLYSDYCVS